MHVAGHIYKGHVLLRVRFNFDWLSSCSSFPIRVILFIKGTVVVKSKFWFQFYVFSEIPEFTAFGPNS